MSVGGTIQTAMVHFGTVAAGTAAQKSIFVAPQNCRILNAYAVNTSTLANDATNHTTLTLRNKGAAGDGTAALGVITSNAASGNVFTAFIPRTFTSFVQAYIPKGHAITLQKENGGSGAATTDLTVVIVYKIDGGLRKHSA
jgi:hypothetical protein